MSYFHCGLSKEKLCLREITERIKVEIEVRIIKLNGKTCSRLYSR